jgi:hypothetical protein
MLGRWGRPVGCMSICLLYCKLIGWPGGRWYDDNRGCGGIIVLIVIKIVGWAQWVSGGSVGLGTGVGQSLCLWLVTVVDLWEGGRVSKHH